MQGNGPHDFMTIDAKEEDVRKGFWKKIRLVGRRIPFMEEVVAGYFCALDAKTPMRSKAILLAALAYFIMPFDAIPDVFFGLGFTDDIAVLTAALAAVRHNITPSHRKAAHDTLMEE